MSAKHTPGPWKKADRLNGPFWHISSEHTVGGKPCIGGRQSIAAVHGESKRGATAYAEMFEANARLIAAAPELLDALIEVTQILDMVLGVTGSYPADADGPAAKARAAIAKATGATQ